MQCSDNIIRTTTLLLRWNFEVMFNPERWAKMPGPSADEYEKITSKVTSYARQTRLVIVRL